MAWLVAGLGNPGETYRRTRHNAGRMVVDVLARADGAKLKKARFVPSEVAEIRMGEERVLLVGSTRFMNESGPSYASIASKQGVEPANVIAVHDELEIPAGELMIKLDGGSGGHNGIKSLTQAIRTPDYHRIRVGIGRPPGRQDPADFVLEPIPKKLEGEFAVTIERAAEAIRSLITEGLETAQQQFNRAAGSP